MARLALTSLGLVATLLCAAAQAQEAPRLELLNERLRIPESERFDEGAYIESGVGLSFGVDKRLAYFPGQYEEAAQRFEEAARRFKYKAEIWVYLARAYFYLKSPEEARDALQRAAAVMPDLSQRLWEPLIESLEWEIRQRATQQQAQIDFYTVAPDDVLSLFRLYLFLQDEEAATDLVAVAQNRAEAMRERARMVSGSSRHAQIEEATRWDDLAQRLTDELRLEGVALPDPAPLSSAPEDPLQQDRDIEEEERLRILQLRVDFYDPPAETFEALFQAYLDRGESERARGVLASLRRRIGDVEVRLSVAPTVDELARTEQELQTLSEMADDFDRRLPATAEAGTSAAAVAP